MNGFNRVIGYESIKDELKRYADALNHPQVYEKIGVTPPKGLILIGKPGVGKTTMARAFVEESNRKLFVLRKEKPNGAFVNEIRDIFKKAKDNAPSIVFLDDLDKFANEDVYHCDAEEYVGVQTGIDNCHGHDVFVLATANTRRNLPESLLRVGRFDKIIEVSPPKGKDAESIIEYYLDKKKVMGNVDVDLILRVMEGRSCAELENVINEAGIYAGYERRGQISQDDFIKACLAMLFEEIEDKHVSEEDDKLYEENYTIRRVAIHEAGHAVVSEVLDPGSVNIVSVRVGMGPVAGLTSIRTPDYCNYSNDLIDNEVIRCLGGRASTEMMLGQTDLGSMEDLERAGTIIENLTGDLLGTRYSKYRSESEAHMSDREMRVRTELEKYYQKTKRILAENRPFLDKITEELAAHNTLTYKDIATIREELK